MSFRENPEMRAFARAAVDLPREANQPWFSPFAIE
jgi:hypothetical protein